MVFRVFMQLQYLSNVSHSHTRSELPIQRSRLLATRVSDNCNSMICTG